MPVTALFSALVALPCQPWTSTPALMELSILNWKASVPKGMRSPSLIFVAFVSVGGRQLGWLVWVPTSAVSAWTTASDLSNPSASAGEFGASVVDVVAGLSSQSDATAASSERNFISLS